MWRLTLLLLLTGCTNCVQTVQQVEYYDFNLNDDVVDGFVLSISCDLNYITITDIENNDE